MCSKARCRCQKKVSFSSKKLKLEGSGFKNKLQKTFEGTQTAWKKVSKPAVNIAAPFIGTTVGPKSKNPQVDEATLNTQKMF